MEVYARAYHPRRPVVCMDETNKQLIGEDADEVVSRFIEGGFLEGYYEEDERIREVRKKQGGAP